MRDEIMPNILSPVLVVATIRMAQRHHHGGEPVLPRPRRAAARRSPGAAWWPTGAKFLADGWWVATLPGLAILVVVLATNLASQGLREAFDPRLHR